ncbi:MAG TPA: ABC transporter substrate binding protein [Spirochaetota bacterium]|nr:ABC transporter substrate binding protein [Spirochaetota bacterium]
MKKLFLVFLVLMLAFQLFSQKYNGKKILYIDSYHEGYEWSDGITNGIKSSLKDTGITLEVFRMDTKRNGSEELKKQSALNAKQKIEQFKPDVVIVSDDNATKYVLAEYYKNSTLPCIFCGVNFDASVYGFPTKNITGMVEMEMMAQIIQNLKDYAKGDRVALLSSDNETSRKVGMWTKKLYAPNLIEFYAKNYAEWKKLYLEVQGKADILLFDNNAGINDWNDKDAQEYVLNNTKIPSGANNAWMTPYTLLGVTKVAEEFGEWSALTAFKILDGTSPADIPVVTNKKGKLSLNMKLANKLGVTFKPAQLKGASEIIK